MWTDVIADGCKGCQWANYSDSSGWFSRSISPSCPVHGSEADPLEPEADG